MIFEEVSITYIKTLQRRYQELALAEIMKGVTESFHVNK